MLTYPERACDRLLHIDPSLNAFKQDIMLRLNRVNETTKRLMGDKQDLSSFADGYMYFGFHRTETGWVFREWLPGADRVFLMGDFNGWKKDTHPLEKLGPEGVWEIRLEGRDALKHQQYVKIVVEKNGRLMDRVPAYIRRAVLNPVTHVLAGQIWAPDEPFQWTDGDFFKKSPVEPPLIYEAHVGMATEKEGKGTYREFADNTLPRIASLGYTAVQLMAIQEHPYYASFGYQVTNFFAPSSHFGTPDDLRYLINKAHALGLHVLLDVVHSHACPNVGEGLNQQDGTDGQYFLEGGRGWHIAWNTRLFDYGKTEVLHFLLSNLKYWQEEFHFDGFRFDGVTSMIYVNHGLGEAFTDYSMYYSMNTDLNALVYLTLANALIHEVNPCALTVAEEMSGMPGMCLPIRSGGIGFDYRLSMGVPDFWIKYLKDVSDDQWDMFKLWHELTTRRPQEKNVAYCESHDQALVGDKTIFFRMADAEMYTGMEKSYHSITMDRAVALHKLIRFVTLTLGGEGYLNFMGNEFGHPEWIDFPREGNGWSFKYARRQWSLVQNGLLKYEWLKNFDQAMLKFARKYRVLNKRDLVNLWIDQPGKIIAFSKGELVYVFNFHPTYSPTNFFLPVHSVGEGRYQVIFSSDDVDFGGMDRISKQYVYDAHFVENRGVGFEIYVPCRTAMVFKRIEE